MKATVNSEYLEGIAKNDFTILEKIYSESLPEVVKHIKRNSGTLDDAKDVFQEGILVIHKKVQDNSLELTTSFHVYLFSVCKRIWLKKLKKKGKKEVTLEAEWEFGYEEQYEERFLKTQKWNLFNQKFEELTEECRKVLKLLFNGFSGVEIAQTMGYTEEYAKRKKYKCKMSLAGLIKKDVRYKSLTES